MAVDPNQISGNTVRRSEIGVSGLRHFGGRIYDEFLQNLRGRRAIQIYEEMRRNDSVVASILFAIEMLMRSNHWKVTAPSQSEQDEEVAEFIESCLFDMHQSWEMTLSDILTFLPFGWAFMEVVYKKRDGFNRNAIKSSQYQDGRYGWQKISIRAQQTLEKWEFDDNGNVLGMWQIAPPEYKRVFIPMQNALLFRTRGNYTSPEGLSVLRSAYRSWYMKKNLQEIELIGAERELTGLPIFWVPVEMFAPDAPQQVQDQKAEFERIIKNLRRDEKEGMVLPLAYDEETGEKRYEFELVSSPGARAVNIREMVAGYDQNIAQTVLADFILLGHEGVGSYALSQDKMHLFTVALNAWMESIAEVFNRDAIPALLRANGMEVDPKSMPMLTPDRIENDDLGALGDYVKRLTDSGATLFPDERVENYLREKADIPLISHEDPEDPWKQNVDVQLDMQQAELDQMKQPPNNQAPPGGQQGGA